jgi:hypothetical protein
MALTRKQALKTLEGLVPQVERHLQRILEFPGHSSRCKWASEVLGWLSQMEEVLPHVGKKTAVQWQGRIDAYRATLEE